MSETTKCNSPKHGQRTLKLIEMWNAGVSAREIAAELRMSGDHYVFTRANALGLKRRRYKDNALYRRMEARADDIVYAIEAGYSVADIADEIGVSRGYPYKLYRDVVG